MTEETKKLIEWIKTACTQRAIRENADNTVVKESYRLLNKLEPIEKILLNGGFIKDRKGRLCKAGDWIYIPLDNLVEKARLLYINYSWYCRVEDSCVNISLSLFENDFDFAGES